MVKGVPLVHESTCRAWPVVHWLAVYNPSLWFDLACYCGDLSRMKSSILDRWGRSHSASASSFEDLLLESFGSYFSLKHSSNALLPGLFQRLDLALHALLL